MVGFPDMMNLIKAFSMRSLAVLEVFPLLSKIRQIFSYFWFWVGNNKLKEFYIFRIKTKSQYCRYRNCYEDFIFSFGEYWSKSLLASSFLITNYLIRFSCDETFFEPVHFIYLTIKINKNKIKRTIKRKSVNLTAGW